MKHGMSDTRIYSIWKDMRKRCRNKNNNNYKYYGGKGIKVCNEWDKFMNFYNWSIKNGYEDNLTIDRINPDDDYKPSNCQWITLAKNIGKRNKNYKNTPNKYIGISPNNKKFNFINASKFAREHNLDASCIIKVCRNKREHHKGWKFKYKNK